MPKDNGTLFPVHLFVPAAAAESVAESQQKQSRCSAMHDIYTIQEKN